MSSRLTRFAPVRSLLLVGLFGAFAAGCSNPELEKANADLKAQVASLQDAAATKEKAAMEIADSLEAVQKAIDEVRGQEMITLQVANKLDESTEGGKTQREKTLADIQGLKQVLETRKQQLEELEGRLAKLQGDNKGLSRTVAKLKAIIAERETRIKELEEAVGSRDARIAILETVVGEKDALIEAQTTQLQAKDSTIQAQADTLNTGYFIAGNKEFLMAKGIVKKTGGVLGLGKSLVPSDIDNQNFTPVKIQQTTDLTLECPSEKVKVLSTHPPASFEVNAAGEKQSTLHIKDAAEFWKTRYLVVLLKCD